MNRKVLAVQAGDETLEIEYWKLGSDAYLVEQKVLLIFVNTKLGQGLSVLPVKSEKVVYQTDTLAAIKKAFTELHEEPSK